MSKIMFKIIKISGTKVVHYLMSVRLGKVTQTHRLGLRDPHIPPSLRYPVFCLLPFKMCFLAYFPEMKEACQIMSLSVSVSVCLSPTNNFWTAW
jgi:hypothetical protein